jgi:hypothetical protein
MKLLLANVIVSLLLPEVSLAQTDRAGPTAQNLRTLNESACAIFQKGHVRIIGVNPGLADYRERRTRRIRKDHGRAGVELD